MVTRGHHVASLGMGKHGCYVHIGRPSRVPLSEIQLVNCPATHRVYERLMTPSPLMASKLEMARIVDKLEAKLSNTPGGPRDAGHCKLTSGYGYQPCEKRTVVHILAATVLSILGGCEKPRVQGPFNHSYKSHAMNLGTQNDQNILPARANHASPPPKNHQTQCMNPPTRTL